MLLTTAAGRRAGDGWPMLLGLSTAQLLSWGILYYAFSVFIRPLEQETGWTRTQISGAFSLALLVAGLAAVPVGRWLDAHGARALMTAGSAWAAAMLAAFATVHSLAGLYLVWLGAGLAMAMVLYEPAFAVVAVRFARHRDRALTVLTIFGGLASTLLVPLATWLLAALGWRRAVLVLAAILALTTVPLHALALRRTTPAPAASATGSSMFTGDPRFWAIAASLTLASVVSVATGVHLIPFLTGKGLSPARAGTVLGAVGLFQLLGRALFGVVRRHLGWRWTGAAAFLVQALSLAILSATLSGPGLALFACLFGAANGMTALFRASTLADLFGAARYGRVSGVVALFSTFGRAGGPALAAVASVALHGYERVFIGLAALVALAAAIVLAPAG